MNSCIIFLAHGFEEIEALTVVDILRRGGISVTLAAIEEGNVRGRSNIWIVPDIYLKDLPIIDFDMLVLPGGLEGVDNLLNDSFALETILKLHEKSIYIGAICAGPKILAHLDIIKDKKVTSYPSEKNTISLKAREYSEEGVVVDGKIITSRGPGTSIDFSLTLLRLLKGDTLANEIKEKILYFPHR